MKDKHSKLRKVIPLVLSLAVGGAGTALADNTVDDSVFNTPTGDFMFVTDYMHKINRNEKTNIDALLKGGNITRIYAISPTEAIQSRINFLNSKEGREFYASKGKKDQRLYLIGRLRNFLNELKKANIAPSQKSLEGLSVAVMDGEIEPEELKNVEDNVYAIVKEGIDKKEGAYSVFYLTKIVSDKTPSQYQTKIRELENDYNELVKKEEETEKALKYVLSELPGRALTPEEQKSEKSIKEKPKETEKKSYFSIITQGTSNEKFDSYTGTLGLRFNPNKDFGLSALLDLGFGLDKLTDSYSAPLSAGRTASGTITDTNKLSIGGSLETQLGPFVIGGGIDYKIWIKNVVEQILDCSGRVVKSNTNSIPNRQVFGKGYLGVEFQPTDGWKLGAILGCNWKDGFYFGIRNNFRLNSKKK